MVSSNKKFFKIKAECGTRSSALFAFCMTTLYAKKTVADSKFDHILDTTVFHLQEACKWRPRI